MKAILAILPRKVLEALKPAPAEVDHYARIILRHERRPRAALAACRREAEMQLWTMRALAVAESSGRPPAAVRPRRARAVAPEAPALRELALA